MTDLVVIHGAGESGGAAWARAFAGWPGTVHAPDLPGHGDAPMSVDGHYEPNGAIFAVAEHLAGEPPVVLGVGVHGHPALMIALGGRACGLVLVDGLGGPWLDVAARNDGMRELRRRILATPAALESHQPPGTDVRATMVLPQSNRDHVVRVASQVTVPTLVVESPASPTPDASAVAATFPDASLVTVDEPAPALVAALVLDWWRMR